MATTGTAQAASPSKEASFLWEGKNKSGKVVRGEMRAAGVTVVRTALRRQGILVTKLKKRKLAPAAV